MLDGIDMFHLLPFLLLAVYTVKIVSNNQVFTPGLDTVPICHQAPTVHFGSELSSDYIIALSSLTT